MFSIIADTGFIFHVLLQARFFPSETVVRASAILFRTWVFADVPTIRLQWNSSSDIEPLRSHLKDCHCSSPGEFGAGITNTLRSPAVDSPASKHFPLSRVLFAELGPLGIDPNTCTHFRPGDILRHCRTPRIFIIHFPLPCNFLNSLTTHISYVPLLALIFSPSVNSEIKKFDTGITFGVTERPLHIYIIQTML